MALRSEPNAFRATSVDDALPNLLRILLSKEDRPSRNGAIREIRGLNLTLERPSRRYVATPGRRVSLPAQIVETMWVLAGRDDIATIEPYLPRAGEFSDDGETWRGAYGPRVRAWSKGDRRHGSVKPGDGDTVDQLAHVVELLREDLDTRRAVISIYDPNTDAAPGKDIPCNDFLIFRATPGGLLNLHVTTRSNDVIWGWSGINTFEWSVLLELVARMTGLGVGAIQYNVASFHLYEHHFDRAREIAGTQLPRSLRFSALRLEGIDSGTSIKSLDELISSWFRLEEKIRTNSLDAHLSSQIDSFPVEAMRVWLQVLRGWWTDSMEKELAGWEGSDLYLAALASPKCPAPLRGFTKADAAIAEAVPFMSFVIDLHAEKNTAYGDSWKRRGEMLGIMANIARKVDRLGVGGAGDTAADTAIDLLVYLIKYRLWLAENVGTAEGGIFGGAIPTASDGLSDNPEWVAMLLRALPTLGTALYSDLPDAVAIETIRSMFDRQEEAVAQKDVRRAEQVETMILVAFPFAQRLWEQEQPGYEVIGKSTTKRFNGYAEGNEAC